MREVRLAYLSWKVAKDYFSSKDIALLPVGSTEQHGPHNPLGTDHLTAYALALEAGKRTGTVVLPPIPFGISSHHSAFPGTIWVSEETFKNYVREVALSLKAHGVRKIIVVNGHGGNLHALVSLAREMRRKGVLMVVFQWWTLPQLREMFSKEELGHAAAAETSLNMVVAPEAVDETAITDEQPVRLPAEDLAFLPERTDDRVKSGVFGVASTASKERGSRLFETAVEALVKLVETVEKSGDKLLAKV